MSGGIIRFVNPPSCDHNCPLCFQLLTDAYQTACGSHICSDCATLISLRSNGRCPKCRRSDCNANKDIFFSHQLRHMEVYCPMAGCTWRGELRYLENHSPICSGARDNSDLQSQNIDDENELQRMRPVFRRVAEKETKERGN